MSDRSNVTTLATATQPAPAPLERFNPQSLWPRSWDETMKLAGFLSKSGLLPQHLQGKPENTFYTIMAGLELGVAPLVACREIYLVNGKPGCSALLKLSMVRQSGLCEKWQEVESTAKKCTIAARRVGDKGDTVRTFTIEEAERAGLMKNPTWQNYPAIMLRRRTQSQLADDLFAEVVRGMADTDDALLSPDEVRWAERVTPPPPPARAANDVPPHDPVTGEVKEDAPVVDAQPVNEFSAAYLRNHLETSTTSQELQARGSLVQKAKAEGKLTPDEHKMLEATYKTIRVSLRTKEEKAASDGGGK